MSCELEVIERKSTVPTNRPPLLFVHGLGHGAWCWAEHFLDYFAAQGFDAYALSLRGHGGSGGRDALRWTSIADYVDDVERTAAGLPRAPVVVGHSLGGMVVQHYLQQHAPPAAVLVAPAPPGGMPLHTTRLFLENPLLALEIFLTREPGRLFSTPERASKFLFSSGLAEDALQRYAAQLGGDSFRALLELTYRRPDPARVRKTPLLVLAGSRDCLTPPSTARRTANAYGADLRILPDIAHDLMLDPGWRRAADAMHEWLIGRIHRGSVPGHAS